MHLKTLLQFLTIGDAKSNTDETGLSTKLRKRTTDPVSRSIKFKSKSLVAQYPILYTDNISSNTINLVNKALEVEYVQLLRLLILNDRVDTDFQGTSEYLSKFHHNIYNNRFSANAFAESVSNLEEDNKELLITLEEDFNFDNLNNKSISNETLSRLYEKEVEPLQEEGKDDSGNKVNIDKVDINKVNSLTPTNVTVDVTYYGRGDGGTTKKPISFGVKCIAHLLKSEHIEKYLPNSIITKTPIMRMIQWTTGEIAFFKDLLLSVDDAKDMAVKGRQGETFWWQKLSDLSRMSKLHPFLRNLRGVKTKQVPIPTATMIITKENVDAIKYQHGVDILTKPRFVDKIMKNFFLMTFAIVDESTETMYMYNEETRNYSTISYASLESAGKQKQVDMNEVYRSIFNK